MAFSRSARIKFLLVIDVIFFFIELIVGYAVGSLALVADSFHMLNDILSLIVALYAIKLTTDANIDDRYSYGWHRAEILAALINGVFLLALCFSIFMEALERFFSAPEISNPRLVVIVGSWGLASNILGLFLFHEHDHSHSNEKTSGDNDGAQHDILEEQSDNGTVVPSDGHGRERSDSLYDHGHPATGLARVVQVARDLQEARSPSPMHHRSISGESSSNNNQSFHTLVQSEVSSDGQTAYNRLSTADDENAPLLRDSTSSYIKPTSKSGKDSESDDGNDSRPRNHGHSHGNMNMRALVLHVLGDALGNVGVIATGLIIWLTDYSWKFYFDPMISLVITVIIFSTALPLVKSASFILLQGVPTGISLEEVGKAIHNIEGVESVHELHIWQLSESKIVASVHVYSSNRHDFMIVAAKIRKTLHNFGIHSSTIQPEYPPTVPVEGLEPFPRAASCLITCPPNQQDCNPTEHGCCPPPPADV